MTEKEAAFKKVYEANSKKIYHLCYGYTGDDDAASDLLQETFLKVWQNLDKFRNQALISTWIYRIAVNTCLTYLRSEKRQAKEELTDQLAETSNLRRWLEGIVLFRHFLGSGNHFTTDNRVETSFAGRNRVSQRRCRFLCQSGSWKSCKCSERKIKS